MRFAFVRLLVALAALMVLPGSAWGGVLYRCQMSGRIQATCCCGAEDKSAEPAPLPAARASDCCERLVPADGSKAMSPGVLTPSIEPAALATVLPVPLAFGPSSQVRAFARRQSRGPPGPTRPLFVVYCALLC
jgi:hypothetical protein